MRLSSFRLVCVLFATPLLVAACEHPQERRDPIPPGVSLDPPRQAPATGSLGLPGQEPAAPLPAGAEEPVLTDTVPVPTERPADQ
jgi:hypothetical protein